MGQGHVRPEERENATLKHCPRTHIAAEYYRKFILNYGDLSYPLCLTELTKKRVPNLVPWNE